jgi:hypothetical protein
MFDVYRNKQAPAKRIATRQGAGLPGHIEPRDWTLMPGSTSQLIDDIEEDIAVRGFCYFELS